jgi:hypothetical protein
MPFEMASASQLQIAVKETGKEANSSEISRTSLTEVLK